MMQATITLSGSLGLRGDRPRAFTPAELRQAFATVERALKNHGFVVMRGDLPHESVTHGTARGNVFSLRGGPAPSDLRGEPDWLEVKEGSLTLEFTMLASVDSL